MKIEAAIIDFDGTITTTDMSDVLAKYVGKEAESTELNRQFLEGEIVGLSGLVQRINFLKGLTTEDFRKIADSNDYLRTGAKELFEYFRAHKIISIISSGSTIPFLEIYQEKLGVDYLVGSRPKMNDNSIASISEEDYSGLDFKVRDSKTILDKLGINASSVIAIGDSPADRGIFNFAAASIAVDPKVNIEKFADFVVKDNLAEVITILDRLGDDLL